MVGVDEQSQFYILVSNTNIMNNKNNRKQNNVTKSISRRSQESVYSIPAALSCSSKGTPPAFGTGITIKRREFVGTATNGATTGFALTPPSLVTPGYDFNPSSVALFPWLAQIAPAFERFRFNKLKFEFVPGQATSTAGRFYAAVDYDYDDLPASNKTELMGNMSSVEASLWSPSQLVTDPRSLNRDLPYRYVSATSRVSSVEGRTAFSGFLMLAFDTAVANCLMDIWVEYEVELVTPVMDLNVVQILSAPATAVAPSAAVTSAVGTRFAGQPNQSTNPYPLGPMSVVASGAPGIPIFSRSFWTGVFANTTALDLKNVLDAATMSLYCTFNDAGAAPNSVLGATLGDVYWNLYDSNGTWLVDTSSVTVDNGISRAIGPITGGGGSVGGYIYQSTTVWLRRVLALYPTLRYIAPMIVSVAGAIGAGNTAWGFAIEK